MNIGVNLPAVPKVEVPDENYAGRIYRGDWTKLLANKTLMNSPEEFRKIINQSPEEVKTKSFFPGIPDSTFILLGEVLFYLLLVVLLVHYTYWGVTAYLAYRKTKLLDEAEDVTEVKDLENVSNYDDRKTGVEYMEYPSQDSYQPEEDFFSDPESKKIWTWRETVSFTEPVEYDIEKGRLTRMNK